jgi:phosphoribosylaminoimidazole (AIR) synthetase
MGIGMVFVFDKEHANVAKTALGKYSRVYEIGHVQAGNKTVLLK